MSTTFSTIAPASRAPSKKQAATEKAVKAQITAYEKFSNELKGLEDQYKELAIAGKPAPDSLIHQITAKRNELKQVEESVKAIGQDLVKISGKTTVKGQSLGNYKATGGNSGLLKQRETGIGELGTGPGEMLTEDKKQMAIDAAQTLSDTTFQIIANAANAEFNLKMSNLEKEKQAKLANTKLTEAEKQKIEDDYNKKAAKLKTEQAKKEKAAAIVQSIINTALSITKASPNIPLMVMAGLAGAAQMAIIASQKIPQFDKGTLSTPDTFIAGERRPEWMISPSGAVSLITKPTLFSGMAGSAIIGGEDTARIMNATGTRSQGEILAPYISKMEASIVNAIQTKSELHISASGSKITERAGAYNKEYFNRKIQWLHRSN